MILRYVREHPPHEAETTTYGSLGCLPSSRSMRAASAGEPPEARIEW